MKKISTFIIELKEDFIDWKRKQKRFFSFTWSAAFGSRFKIKLAASLFFETIEQANGVWFCLLRIERSKFGARINTLMIFICWLIIATWRGVLPSESYNLTRIN